MKKKSRLSSAAVVIGTVRVKVYWYTSMFIYSLYQRKQLSDFLFASLDKCQKKNALKRKTKKGGKNESGRVASPESVPIHLKSVEKLLYVHKVSKLSTVMYLACPLYKFSPMNSLKGEGIFQ